MKTLQSLLDCVAAGETCILATVVGVEGSAPRKDGARMVVTAGGDRFGTVGGGQIEEETLVEARAMLTGREATKLIRRPVRCGGEMTVHLERFSPDRRLVVVGGGHVGSALAGAGLAAGFRVTVITPDGNPRRIPAGVETLAGTAPTMLGGIEGSSRTHVVVATGDLEADVGWAVAALAGEFASVGVVGSGGKAAAVRHQAAASGIVPERIHALRCPVGLDLGAVTPEEIAVAIVAELVLLERRGEVPEGWRRASRG